MRSWQRGDFVYPDKIKTDKEGEDEIMRDQSELEAALSYRFEDKELLLAALTHSSYANEQRSKNRPTSSNERLEFLGDAVLELYITSYLYYKYPRATEGELARMRERLVCEAALASAAASIGLGDFLRLGKGEEQHGSRSRPSILADALEALIAAVHIDSGEAETERLIIELFGNAIDSAYRATVGDPKTRLQQLVQQGGIEELTYRVVREDGPLHRPYFEVEALINSNVVGRGSGKSKRDAEQSAAKEALALFGISEN